MSASLPNSVPALLSVVGAVLPSGFQSKLGVIVGAYVAPQTFLVTGATFSKDDPAELGPTYRHEEAYAIKCSLLSSSGGPDDEPTRLQEVYGLYQTISVTIANNPTLNQTVRVAWTRQLSYNPTYDAIHGWSVGQLDFEVQCQVRVTSLS